MQKLAIFGGTFNPIHRGHLLVAETALSQFQLNQIIWVPTYHPPHKVSILSYTHRCEMVKRAIQPYFSFAISTAERDRAAADSPRSYAIDTLRLLQTDAAQTQWFWILGLDAFCSLPRWVGRRELAATCTWLVAPRCFVSPPLDLTAAHKPSGSKRLQSIERIEACTRETCAAVARQLAREAIAVQWQILPMSPVEISSSLIRQSCQQQSSIQHLVPDSVSSYIATHHLYRCDPDAN